MCQDDDGGKDEKNDRPFKGVNTTTGTRWERFCGGAAISIFSACYYYRSVSRSVGSVSE
jgi:hypothetical protein